LQHDYHSLITMMTQEEKSILSFDGYSLSHVKRRVFTRAHSQGSSGSTQCGTCPVKVFQKTASFHQSSSKFRAYERYLQ